jgi:hypothetical protein
MSNPGVVVKPVTATSSVTANQGNTAPKAIDGEPNSTGRFADLSGFALRF